MDRGLALPLAAAVGGLVALQAPLNASLGRAVGDLPAVILAFLVGLAALLLLALLTRPAVGSPGTAAWYELVGGGLIGATYVASIVVTVRALGAAGLTAATIAGQLTVAVVIDHFGWLGVERDRLDAAKVLGVALLAVGTWLVVRD